MDPRQVALRSALAAAGQGHLNDALDRVEGDARTRLAAQLADLDLPLLPEMRRCLPTPAQARRKADFAPPEIFPANAEAVRRGEEELRAGRVAWLRVAGGQASRLGLEAPKGTFPVGPVTDRSLYEIFARKLRGASARYGAAIPWYVMTSQANDAATREFFERHAHFGLDPADVTFFTQGMLQ